VRAVKTREAGSVLIEFNLQVADRRSKLKLNSELNECGGSAALLNVRCPL